LINNQFDFCSSSFFYFCNFIKQKNLPEFKHINFDLILDILTKTTVKDCIICTTRKLGITTASMFYISYLICFTQKKSNFLISHFNEKYAKECILNSLETINKLFDNTLIFVNNTSNILVQNNITGINSKIIVKSKLNINLLKSQIEPFDYFIQDSINDLKDLDKWLELRTFIVSNTEKELIYSTIDFNNQTREIISKTHNIIQQ